MLVLWIYLFHYIKKLLRHYINAVNSFIPLHQIILLYIKTMDIYCVSCKENIVNKNSRVRRTKQNRLMVNQILLFMVRENQDSLKLRSK